MIESIVALGTFRLGSRASSASGALPSGQSLDGEHHRQGESFHRQLAIEIEDLEREPAGPGLEEAPHGETDHDDHLQAAEYKHRPRGEP